MVRPIIACENPYETAKQYEAAGWHIDFVQPPESGDPLVGVSLCGSPVLLGVTEGYVEKADIPYIGCGVEFYIDVPRTELERIHESHLAFSPTDIVEQPWGEWTFHVKIGGHAYMIAGEK